MSIKKIFKNGRAELKRTSSLRSSKRNLTEKGKAYEVKLTALGKKARDAKLDISQFGDLSGTLSQIEGKGKEIGAKLNELNKQTAELEGKKKAENSRFDALWKDLETKKKPVDSELRSEKDKLEKAQKEAESIQKRLKNIPDEEEKIRKKITESQGNAQAQAELEKKLTALKEEQKQLDPKLPDLTKIIQAAKEKITPLDQKSGRLEAEMKKAKDQHKKEIEDIDKTLSMVKGEINEFNKQQKAVSGQQVQNFQALGEKLSEANVKDPAIAAELEAAKAAEKEMASIRTNIQTLEGQKAAGARGAVWKMAGLVVAFLAIIIGIVVALILLKKPRAEKKDSEDRPKTAIARVEKSETQGSQKQSFQTIEPQTAERLEGLFTAMEEAAKEIPRDTFDPTAVVKEVGSDPQKIFVWVRDNTYLVPYLGTLRGPIGVLMDRLGNSLDRALLLRELLNVAGHRARLVRGTLSKEQAEDVLLEARPIPPGGARRTETIRPESTQELTTKLARQFGLDPSELQREIQKVILEEQKMAELVAQRVEEQAKAIWELLGEPKIDIRAAELTKAVEALRNHWWVQWQGEPGWIDLDPTLPAAESGKTLAQMEGASEPDDLDKTLLHLVTIRVVIERWQKDRLEEKKVLEQTLRPSELFGKRISLWNVPVNGLKNSNLYTEGKPLERMRKLVLEVKEWLPVLSVDSNKIAQSSFTESGQVNESPGRKGQPSGVSGITGGLFRALGGEEKEQEKRGESTLTAEWIEYQIHVPGQPVRTIRRQVFDWIGSGNRLERKAPSTVDITEQLRFDRGLALLNEHEILIQVCALSPDFLAHSIIEKLLSNREVLPGLLSQADYAKDMAEQTAKISPLPGPEHSLALARREWNRMGLNVYLDRPNILSYFRGLRPFPPGAVVVFHGFDIIDNEVAVIPNTDLDPFQVRLEQGILDTNAETILMGSSGEAVENTAEIFTRSKAQDIKWLTIRDARDPAWQRVNLPKDMRARIEQDLAESYIVLVPSKAVSLEAESIAGWWRINPRTGNILGMMGPGKGQGMTEYIKALGWGIIFCGLYVALTPGSRKTGAIWCVIGGSLTMIAILTRFAFLFRALAILTVAKIILKF